jgi:hypothetical protein
VERILRVACLGLAAGCLSGCSFVRGVIVNATGATVTLFTPGNLPLELAATGPRATLKMGPKLVEIQPFEYSYGQTSCKMSVDQIISSAKITRDKAVVGGEYYVLELKPC